MRYIIPRGTKVTPFSYSSGEERFMFWTQYSAIDWVVEEAELRQPVLDMNRGHWSIFLKQPLLMVANRAVDPPSGQKYADGFCVYKTDLITEDR